jgi:hypothetical protein
VESLISRPSPMTSSGEHRVGIVINIVCCLWRETPFIKEIMIEHVAKGDGSREGWNLLLSSIHSSLVIRPGLSEFCLTGDNHLSSIGRVTQDNLIFVDIGDMERTTAIKDILRVKNLQSVALVCRGFSGGHKSPTYRESATTWRISALCAADDASAVIMVNHITENALLEGVLTLEVEVSSDNAVEAIRRIGGFSESSVQKFTYTKHINTAVPPIISTSSPVGAPVILPLPEDLSGLRQQIQELKAKLLQTQNHLQNAKNATERARISLEEVNGRLSQANVLGREKDTQIETLLSKMQRLKSYNDASNANITRSASKIEELEARLRGLTSSNTDAANLRRELQRLTEEIEREKTSTRAAVDAQEDSLNDIREIQQQLRKLKGENTDLIEKLKNANAETTSALISTKDARDNLIKAQDTIRKQNDRISILEAEIEQLTETANATISDLEKARKAIGMAKIAEQEMRGRITEIENNRDEQLNSLHTELRGARLERAEEMQAAQVRIEMADARIAAMEGEGQNVRGEIHNLEQQLLEAIKNKTEGNKRDEEIATLRVEVEQARVRYAQATDDKKATTDAAQEASDFATAREADLLSQIINLKTRNDAVADALARAQVTFEADLVRRQEQLQNAQDSAELAISAKDEGLVREVALREVLINLRESAAKGSAACERLGRILLAQATRILDLEQQVATRNSEGDEAVNKLKIHLLDAAEKANFAAIELTHQLEIHENDRRRWEASIENLVKERDNLLQIGGGEGKPAALPSSHPEDGNSQRDMLNLQQNITSQRNLVRAWRRRVTLGQTGADAGLARVIARLDRLMGMMANLGAWKEDSFMDYKTSSKYKRTSCGMNPAPIGHPLYRSRYDCFVGGKMK